MTDFFLSFFGEFVVLRFFYVLVVCVMELLVMTGILEGWQLWAYEIPSFIIRKFGGELFIKWICD
jgi:hypothetical protein